MPAPLLVALAPIIGDIARRIVDTLSDVIGGPEKRKQVQQQLELELSQHLQKVDLAQIGVNLEEAKSASLFVAGWRPFIGWVCGAGVAYAFLFKPLFGDFYATVDPTVKLPDLDVGELMTLLLGMLGMAGYRTFEKVKGVSRRTIRTEHLKEPEQ